MTKYNMTVKGSIENVAGFLAGLIEDKSTPLNRNYEIAIKDANWSSSSALSIATLEVDSSDSFSRNDIGVIRDQYGVTVSTRRA